MSVTTPEPPAAPPGPRGLLLRIRGFVSLSRAQAIFGLIAALISIGGALYGYLRPGRAPDTGEILATVQEAKSGTAVADASVELLAPSDALVTTLTLSGGQVRRRVKEGPYRLRVTHPQYVAEVRPIQVVAGQTTEIRVRLAPPPPPPRSPAPSPTATSAAKPPPAKSSASAKSPPPKTTPATSPVGQAERVINEGVDSIKKIFR